MTDKKQPPKLILTLVNPVTLELHVEGTAPNIDVALAMIQSALRVMDYQWKQMADVKAMQQAENQMLAESLLSPQRRPS